MNQYLDVPTKIAQFSFAKQQDKKRENQITFSIFIYSLRFSWLSNFVLRIVYASDSSIGKLWKAKRENETLQRVCFSFFLSLFFFYIRCLQINIEKWWKKENVLLLLLTWLFFFPFCKNKHVFAFDEITGSQSDQRSKKDKVKKKKKSKDKKKQEKLLKAAKKYLQMNTSDSIPLSPPKKERIFCLQISFLCEV